MSALPLMRLVGGDAAAPAPVPPASPAGGCWLWLDVAAERMGLDERYLRTRCGKVWAPAGLAKLAKRDSGQEMWRVHTDADPRLAPPSSEEAAARRAGEERAELIRGMTDAQRGELLEREEAVALLDEAERAGEALGLPRADVVAGVVKKLRAKGRKVSGRTLYRWAAASRAGGAEGLVDGRRHAPVAAGPADAGLAAYPRYLDVLRRLYLEPNGLSATACHRMAAFAARESGEAHPSSDRTARRYLAAIPKAVVVRRRKGLAAFERECEPHVRRAYAPLGSNERWVADDHTLDVLVTHEGRTFRPTLHAWQDERSRKVLAWELVEHAPNAELVLKVWGRAVLEHGVPDGVRVDNGKHFDSRAVQGQTKKERQSRQAFTDEDLKRVGGAWALAGVKVQHARPYRGQAKLIESWFGKLCANFARLFRTYVGPHPAAKPDGLADREARGQHPTLDEVRRELAAYVADAHNGTAKLGDGMEGRSPDAVYRASFKGAVRRMSAEDLALCLMPRVGPLRVGQTGVVHRGVWYGGREVELLKRMGDKVMVAYPVDDASWVLALDLKGKAICRCASNERLPANATPQDVREANRKVAELKKAVLKYDELKPRLALDVVELARLEAAERAAQTRTREAAAVAAGTGTDGPASIAIARTPVDDHLNDLRRAVHAGPTLRLAGGGDTDGYTGAADAAPIDTRAALRAAMDRAGDDVGADDESEALHADQ